MSSIPNFHPVKASARASKETTTIKSPLPSPPRQLETLTLGCKISFVLVFPHYHLVKSDIQGTAKDIVRNTLATTTFKDFECKYCSTPHEYELPLSLKDPNDSDKRNKLWHVDIDHNAHLHDDESDDLAERYYAVGVQVISRVFKFHNKTNCPGDKFTSPIDGNWIYHNYHERRAQHHWSVEIKAVDDALKTLSRKPNYRVLTNEFTDFKVYVGNNHHGVHMDVARSLLAIFTAFERQFDAINITPRISGGVNGQPAPVASKPDLYHYYSDDKNTIQEEAGESSKPMSSLNMAYLSLQGINTGYDIRTFLRIFLKGDLSRVQLQKIIDNELISHRNTVLDVSRVWDDKLIAYNREYVTKHCMKKPTVTFRSHASTLDSDEQIAWIDLCCILTELCYEKDLRHINNWTRKRWTDPHNEYTILSILHHVDGYNNDTFTWYKKMSVPIKDPKSTIESPHIPSLTLEMEAELAHSDPLKTTRVPEAVLVGQARHKRCDNVRDKIKHKFDMGLYGKFPKETVIEFMRDHHEKKAFLKSDWQKLILKPE
ncbi:unnamed protein product [Aureobasidium uvarum]|uniref:Uncharacterized protein n=1 Tax=Aureobasidium uvarum TaxID=2773716 RepID=A0A9N8PU32_9PEZI|nr:unnamed protein product [Aureobasidium uvarum]